MILHKIARRIIYHSVADNVQYLRAKLFSKKTNLTKGDKNDMLDELCRSERIGHMLGRSLKLRGIKETTLLGDPLVLSDWVSGLSDEGVTAHIRAWDWEDTVPGVVARIPTTNEHWETISKGKDLMLLSELLGPFSVIQYLHSKFNYFVPMNEAIDHYLGYKSLLPLQTLNEIFPFKRLNELIPIKGKSVIEFGPFDGYQTAALCSLGAIVTAIEARAENAIKTQAGLAAAGLSARIINDDFHNAGKYGRFDLAFAHGVYYHSIAPFVFLQNLVDLSDNILVGGFCATDELPGNDWDTLTHKGETYRVKQYHEGTDFTSGINSIGYFFQGDDLMMFFNKQNFKVTVISDEQPVVTAGRYLRFLAQRH